MLLTILFSSTVRATFGFADALIAMPILVVLLGAQTATPLVALIALCIAANLLYKNYRKIDFKEIRLLIFFSLLGIIPGLIFLKSADETLIKGVLATLLIGFSLYKLFRPNLFHLKTNRSAAIFGLVAGMLGGAYNTNGPPIIIYGTLRRWSSKHFRDTLQGVLLPINIAIVTGHAGAGLWTAEVWILFLWSLPLVVLAIWGGNKLNKLIPADKFTKY
ncbi:MAG: sulfite exporter TauE/SafE family protein, partial [Chlorobi bacterium]|nr:sulfite exporter TauE/SafE family protein [Chlorobiota bacterium]